MSISHRIDDHAFLAKTLLQVTRLAEKGGSLTLFTLLSFEGILKTRLNQSTYKCPIFTNSFLQTESLTRKS